MSESGLSVGFPELIGETGRFLGYGYKAYASYTASQQTELSGLVQSAVRRVYYPTALSPEFSGYEWSWLRPTSTIAVVAADGDYDLPDNFGRLIGSIHFPVDTYYPDIQIVSVSKLLGLRAIFTQLGLSKIPCYAATRYKTSTGASGQRQEILFYPTPQQAWTLVYEYEAYSGALSSSFPYPLGGMQLAELYIESCLATAESRLTDEIGIHAQTFGALLVDAISRDRKRGSRFFGNMGHKEDEGQLFRRGYGASIYPLTINGDVI